MDTIEVAVLLAASHHAALVPLLILTPQMGGKESAWISRLRERISHWRPGHRQPALKALLGQEVALTGRAEVPDLE